MVLVLVYSVHRVHIKELIRCVYEQAKEDWDVIAALVEIITNYPRQPLDPFLSCHVLPLDLHLPIEPGHRPRPDAAAPADDVAAHPGHHAARPVLHQGVAPVGPPTPRGRRAAPLHRHLRRDRRGVPRRGGGARGGAVPARRVPPAPGVRHPRPAAAREEPQAGRRGRQHRDLPRQHHRPAAADEALWRVPAQARDGVRGGGGRARRGGGGEGHRPDARARHLAEHVGARGLHHGQPRGRVVLVPGEQDGGGERHQELRQLPARAERRQGRGRQLPPGHGQDGPEPGLLGQRRAGQAVQPRVRGGAHGRRGGRPAAGSAGEDVGLEERGGAALKRGEGGSGDGIWVLTEGRLHVWEVSGGREGRDGSARTEME